MLRSALRIRPFQISQISRLNSQRYFALSAIARERKYTVDHEWLVIKDGIGTIGITEFAQEQLGDVVFVDLPEVGKPFESGEIIGAVESVKAASDIYSPLNGTVVEVNTELSSTSSLLNSAPYEAGWIAKLKLSDNADTSKLLTEEEYQKHIN